MNRRLFQEMKANTYKVTNYGPPGSKNRRRARGAKRATTSLGPRPTPRNSEEVIERGIPGFQALRYKCRLNYYDNLELTSGAGSAGTYVYSANGLYDPDITGTGHQPMPFDQLMLSFEHYCVIGSKMTITAKNQNVTYLADVSISLNAGSAAVTNYGSLVENGVLVRRRLNLGTLPGSQASLEIPISISKFGNVPQLLDNPDYNGSIAANPAEQSYFHISVWNTYNTTTVAVLVEVFIEFDAWFFEPRKNSASIEKKLKKLLLSELESKKDECKK